MVTLENLFGSRLSIIREKLVAERESDRSENERERQDCEHWLRMRHVSCALKEAASGIQIGNPLVTSAYLREATHVWIYSQRVPK
jgi:hypothetical protein